MPLFFCHRASFGLVCVWSDQTDLGDQKGLILVRFGWFGLTQTRFGLIWVRVLADRLHVFSVLV